MVEPAGRFYGLDNLDQRLLPHLPDGPGTFVELGAFDGINQNNTYWLEQNRGWRGILIEPIPEVFRRCVANRPLATVVNCACVAPDYGERDIEMVYSGLMSIVRGARLSDEADEAWVARGEQLQQLQRYSVRVPVRTLTSVLAEYSRRPIDLLSLDVEGYELQVVQGLDLDRFRPRNILIEESGTSAISDHLARYQYYPACEISRRAFTRDILYRPRSGDARSDFGTVSLP
jgi:FkbM family methyltransferase